MFVFQHFNDFEEAQKVLNKAQMAEPSNKAVIAALKKAVEGAAKQKKVELAIQWTVGSFASKEQLFSYAYTSFQKTIITQEEKKLAEAMFRGYSQPEVMGHSLCV